MAGIAQRVLGGESSSPAVARQPEHRAPWFGIGFQQIDSASGINAEIEAQFPESAAGFLQQGRQESSSSGKLFKQLCSALSVLCKQKGQWKNRCSAAVKVRSKCSLPAEPYGHAG
ncbi:hypothetical protein D3C85_1409960 [compost metagenome]